MTFFSKKEKILLFGLILLFLLGVGFDASALSYSWGMSKGLTEPCEPYRKAYFFGANAFASPPDASGWNCLPSPWDPILSPKIIDVSYLSPGSIMAVVTLDLQWIVSGTSYIASFKWYRGRDNALLSENSYTIPNPAPNNYWQWYYVYSWIGYMPGKVWENEAYYVNIKFTTAGGTGLVSERIDFTTIGSPPVVNTESATNVRETTATLVGVVTNNQKTLSSVRFVWGETSSYGNASPWSSYSYNSGDYFQHDLSGLTRGKTYHFRAEGYNGGAGAYAYGYGFDNTFATSPAPPSNFTATVVSQSQVDLFWTKGEGAYYTVGFRCPSSITNSLGLSCPLTDFDLIWWLTFLFPFFTTTGTSYSDTGLTAGTTYYYYIFSLEASQRTYSDSLAEASATPSTPTCSALSFPTDKWQRVWYNYDWTCLGNGPDETNTDFNNDWGTGYIRGTVENNIIFKSSRSINFTTAGPYQFVVGSDDGIKLWIDGSLKVDDWNTHTYTTHSFTVVLSAGWHNFELHYFEATGAARVSFNHTFSQDQLDCSAECFRRGYPGGECLAYSPPPFMCLYCCSEGYADTVPDVGACAGALVGCECCHACPFAPPISGSATVGTCSVAITPKGWDCDPGEGGCNSNVRYRCFNKGSPGVTRDRGMGDPGCIRDIEWGHSNWVSIGMRDTPTGTCYRNLDFSNSWSTVGDQITVTTQINAKDADHDLDAGFDISVNVAGTCWGFRRVGFDECLVSLTGVDVVRNSGSGSKTFDIEYCGDGETNCGEVCDSSNPNDPNKNNCSADCARILDTTPPTSKIIDWSPGPVNNWFNKSFKIKVEDIDPESGIKTGSCKYSVWTCDGGTGTNCILTLNMQSRPCNGWIDSNITVGSDISNLCRKEGPYACYIHVYSENNVNMSNINPEAYRYHKIDWTPPTTEIK